MSTTADNAVADLTLAGTYTGIESRVLELVPDDLPSLPGVSVTGRFFYLTFRDRMPTVDEFVDYIYWRIIPFCIPREKRERYRRSYSETGDERYMMELGDQARHLFIKSLNSLKCSGEVGELILFVLLEAFLGAPQVACKMFLKTSAEMPVHGSDSIHALYDRNTGYLQLIWGESKLYHQISSSMDEICSSVSTFWGRSGGNPPRNRDIAILKDHVNIPDPDMREAFLQFLDPYTRFSNQLSEAVCCFSGFDFSAYGELSAMGRDEVESYFESAYSRRCTSALKLFGDKIVASGLQGLALYYFLLPFPSVQELRRAFYVRLGLDADLILSTLGGNDAC